MFDFGILDGKLADDRTFNTVFRQGGGELHLTLRRYTSDENLALSARFGLSGSKADWPGFRKHVAEKCFLGFEGARDANQNDLPNTQEIRALMLLDNKALFDFVLTELRKDAAETEEGKDGAA